jgi:hypothetical protein
MSELQKYEAVLGPRNFLLKIDGVYVTGKTEVVIERKTHELPTIKLGLVLNEPIEVTGEGIVKIQGVPVSVQVAKEIRQQLTEYLEQKGELI